MLSRWVISNVFASVSRVGQESIGLLRISVVDSELNVKYLLSMLYGKYLFHKHNSTLRLQITFINSAFDIIILRRLLLVNRNTEQTDLQIY